jgi:CheY-like chemotaxis protein
VEDTGVGIPEAMLEEVFGLFTQVDRSLDRSEGGLGVGLSLVRRLVELHEGIVTAESAGLGWGSTFTIRLPITEGSGENRSHSEIMAGGTSLSDKQTSRRVLLVDDNIDGVTSLAMLLWHIGHTAKTAYTGPDGLAAARDFQPDVIVLDIGLPGMDGYELSRRIRADPDLANTTLVALTGWGTEEDKQRAIEAGFNFHLTKPVEIAKVEAILATPAHEK